jgi:hypothetical protein
MFALFTSEGWMDFEKQYVPGCVAAELPDGRAESMRALGIAARTYLLCRIAEDPELGTEAKPIPNHARFQVFQRNAPAGVWEVVATTRGIVCRHGGELVLCNHVLGAPLDANGKPLEDDPTDTEQYVTNNSGQTGAAVKPSPISNTSRPDNRGCMSTRGADWLARQGYNHAELLRFYYGTDLSISPFNGLAPSPQPPAQNPSQQLPTPLPPVPWPPMPQSPGQSSNGPAPTLPAATPTAAGTVPAERSASPFPALALAALAFLAKREL